MEACVVRNIHIVLILCDAWIRISQVLPWPAIKKSVLILFNPTFPIFIGSGNTLCVTWTNILWNFYSAEKTMGNIVSMLGKARVSGFCKSDKRWNRHCHLCLTLASSFGKHTTFSLKHHKIHAGKLVIDNHTHIKDILCNFLNDLLRKINI